jgi:hypothetical protein
MAEETTEQQTSAELNGHKLLGVTWTKALDVLVRSEDHGIFINGLIHAVSEDGNACLFKPHIKQRCAQVKLEAPELYHGIVIELLTTTLPMRWREWDHEIGILVLAMAELDTIALSQVEPEDIAWLWYPYIPLKKLTMFEGDPSAGKTYLLLAIAAAITRGESLPDQLGRVGKPDSSLASNVLYVTAEDGLADTIRPRAGKVHADLDRFFVPTTPQSFSLAQPQALSNAIQRHKPKLVVLDPLQAFLGADVDMHRSNEVRPLMTTLLALAIEFECAMVCVRHWTKASGARARHRGQGNVDFAAAARSVLSIGESPEDETLRIMAQAKASLAGLGTSMVFQITDTGLEWAGTSTMTADELSEAQPQRHKKQRQPAMEWLRDFLHGGPQASQLIATAANAVGINSKALRRAKEALGILATKEGNAWYWRLPKFQKWDRYAGMEDDGDVPF